eukprot:jgi/Botrbrau1/14554/Bobra.0170s0010.1
MKLATTHMHEKISLPIFLCNDGLVEIWLLKAPGVSSTRPALAHNMQPSNKRGLEGHGRLLSCLRDSIVGLLAWAARTAAPTGTKCWISTSALLARDKWWESVILDELYMPFPQWSNSGYSVSDNNK